MATSVGAPALRRDRRWLHLLWAVPAAVAASLVPLFLATISLCGISGCTGGGFGVTDSGRAQVVPFLVLGALVVASPFVLLPWRPARRPRLVVAAVVFVGWLALTGVPILLAWRSAAPPL